MPRFNLKHILNLCVKPETTSLDFSNLTVADYNNVTAQALCTTNDFQPTAITLTPEGNLIISSSEFINIYNSNTLELMKTIKKPKPGISSNILYLPNNLLAFNEQISEQIYILDLTTENIIRELKSSQKASRSMALIDDRLLVSALDPNDNHQGKLHIWDYLTGKLKQELNIPRLQDFAITLLKLNDGLLAAGTRFGIIDIWDIVTGTHVFSLEGHLNYIFKLVEMNDGILVSCSQDKTMRMWNVSAKTCIQVWQNNPIYYAQNLEKLNDGTLIASAGNNINFLNPLTSNCIRTLSTEGGSISGFVVLTDGTLVSCGFSERKSYVWNASRPLQLSDFELALYQLKRNKNLVSLNFNGVSLGDKGAELLIEIVRAAPNLLTLNLQNTKITAIGAQKIIYAVASHPTIQNVLFSPDALTQSLTEELQTALSRDFSKQLVDYSKSFIKKSTFMDLKALDDSPNGFNNAPAWLNTQTWNDKLKEFDNIKNIILDAMKESVQEIRQLPVYDIGATTLQFDVGVIYKVLSQINNVTNTSPTTNTLFRINNLTNIDPDTIVKFCAYSKQLLKDHAANVDGLTQQIGDIVNNDFVKHINNLSAKINGVVAKLGTIENVTQPISTIISTIQSINPALEAVNQIILKTGQFKFDIKSIEDVANKLLAKAQELIPTDVELYAKNINQGLQLISILAGLAGQSNLANQIAVVGNAAVTIISNIASFATIAAASGPLAPIVAIAGAISSLFSIFSSQPNPNQVLLDHINKLATHINQRFSRIEDILNTMYQQLKSSFERLKEQLDNIENNINTRFNYLREQIDNLGKQVNSRFDFIEDMLGGINKDTIERFAHLSNQIDKLQTTANSIKQQVDRIEAKIDAVAKQLYEKSYIDARNYILQFHQDFPYPDYKLSQEKMLDFYSLFRDWTLQGIKNPLLASEPADDITKDNFTQKIFSYGISSNINLFAEFSFRNFGIIKRGQLANPTAYVDAALTFVKFFELLPEFKVLPEHIYRIDQISLSGENLRSFIFDIKSNSKLFKALLSDYKGQLRTLSYLSLDAYFDLKLVPVFTLDKVVNLGGRLIELKKDITDLLTKPAVVSKYGIYIDLKTIAACLTAIEAYIDTAHNNLNEIINNISMNDLINIQKKLNSVLTNIQLALANTKILNADDPTPAINFIRLISQLQLLLDQTLQLMASLIKLELNLATINKRLIDVELIKNYMDKFDIKMLESKLISNVASDKKFKSNFKNLDVSFQLLLIYTIFAFQSEYKSDTNIAAYIQVYLWNTIYFLTNLRTTYTNVILIKSYKSFWELFQNEVIKSADEFEIFLEEKIQLSHDKKMKYKQIDPVLDNVLNILKNFKSRYSINSEPHYSLLDKQQPNVNASTQEVITRDKNSIKALIAKKQKESDLYKFHNTDRKWARKDLRDYIYDTLDKLSLILLQFNIEIILPDIKYANYCSKEGWQLFAFEGQDSSLAITNFKDSNTVLKLIEIINGNSALAAKAYKSNHVSCLGIWISSTVNVEKEINYIVDALKQEFINEGLKLAI